MSAPKRIQRKRTKGWRMPEGAVYVGRGSRWGNPHRVVELQPGRWATEHRGFRNGRFGSKRDAARWAVVGFSTTGPDSGVTDDDVRRELSGRDLACWCPLDQPCHADVLLRIANAS